MTRVPSIGVSSPSLTAERTLLAALEASIASFISDKGKDTDLSLGAGAMRSIQRRRARTSPSSALDIAVCVRASAWPSSKLSMASVYLFLAPLGHRLLRNKGHIKVILTIHLYVLRYF